jgi:hypothetical protein
MQDWKKWLAVAAAGVALTMAAAGAPLEAQGRGRGNADKVEKTEKIDKVEKAEKPATARETPRWRLPGRVIPQKYEEPAFARGYEAGKERGLADAKSGDRYDPVASRAYRDGDVGYAASYGSRDAYKSNYRAGFRQGYEEGYRNSNR